MKMILHPTYTPLEKTMYKRAVDDKIKYLEKYKKLS